MPDAGTASLTNIDALLDGGYWRLPIVAPDAVERAGTEEFTEVSQPS